VVWIFQGNPDRFDVDDYLSRYPELVYWITPRFASKISVGDRAYIWRSGKNAGAVAVGAVIESPSPGRMVKHPEALGADLWQADVPDTEAVRTGIRIDEIRLSASEDMVTRERAKAHHLLGEATIIKMPNGTVFNLDEAQAEALDRLWGVTAGSPAGSAAMPPNEGARKLVSHFRRERSSRLRKSKIDQVRAERGQCVCDLCGMSESKAYPAFVGERIFEVHHLSPLSRAASPVGTTLDDLALLCASCHRATHSTLDVEGNYGALRKHFGYKS